MKQKKCIAPKGQERPEKMTYHCNSSCPIGKIVQICKQRGGKNQREYSKAWRKLCDLYNKHLMSLIRGRMFGSKQQSDVEDLLYRIWEKVLRGIAKYEDRCFKGWVNQIARNAVTDRNRIFFNQIGKLDAYSYENEKSNHPEKLLEAILRVREFHYWIMEVSGNKEDQEIYTRLKFYTGDREALAAEMNVERNVIDQRISRVRRRFSEYKATQLKIRRKS